MKLIFEYEVTQWARWFRDDVTRHSLSTYVRTPGRVRPEVPAGSRLIHIDSRYQPAGLHELAKTHWHFDEQGRLIERATRAVDLVPATQDHADRFNEFMDIAMAFKISEGAINMSSGSPVGV